MMARSLLYVPGDKPSMLERAPEREADALILDLEDAVAARSKDEALRRVATWIAEHASRAKCEIWVRVNAGGRLVEDISGVLHPDVTGIVLPKATTTTASDADAALRHAEEANGLEIGHVPVVALIESAVGVLDLRDIAAHPRVRQMALGEIDLSADLGITVTDDESELQPLRLDLVVASAAAGKPAPIGPVSAQVHDLDRLHASTERLRQMGFRSRQAIHPSQVQVINQVFTPSDEEMRRARHLVQLFESAVQRGQGVIVDADGRMVDEAVIRLARQTLNLPDPD